METLRRLRDAAARRARRLTAAPASRTRWIDRARRAGFLGTTVLLVWELRITAIDPLPDPGAIFRVAAVLLLYGVGRWPFPAAALSVPLLAASLYIGPPPASMAVLTPMAITAVLIATQPRYRGYLYAAIAIGIITLVSPSDPLLDLAAWIAFFTIPCLIGEAARYLLSSIARIRADSHAQLHRQRRLLARELHDTSIHDITAMIMALERAKLTGIEDPHLLEEIDHAIATGRQSVVSMRGVLKILRAEDHQDAGRETDGVPEAIAATAPTVNRALEDARGTLERAGHEVRLHIEDQIDAPMSFSVRTALVRVIQECTANMAKYARAAAPCTIMVERTDTETRALFMNEADPAAPEDAALSSGLGLIGVRERVEAVGGQLAMRHHDGRWILQVSIPTIGSTNEGQVERAERH